MLLKISALAGLIILLGAGAALATYPAGYFYYIFDGHTQCVIPVKTDSTTEAEWFDYGSWSMHTGHETPNESHVFFFYNPFSGNIGLIVQHNEDAAGSWGATVRLWLDHLPSGCYRAISDDEWEFDLSESPEGDWLFTRNSDGGAFYIPRDEWTFNARLRFGGMDPLEKLYFLSGDLGSDKILISNISSGTDYNITLGHGFLQIIPEPSDSIYFRHYSVGSDTIFDITVRNSDETSDLLELYGGFNSNPLFTIDDYTPDLAPGEYGSISVRFAGGGVGTYIDTLTPNTNEPCFTKPIFVYVKVMPPAMSHIGVETPEGTSYLRVVDTTFAEDAGNGVLMLQTPEGIGAADLVDTSDVDASPILIKTTSGIRAWRKRVLD